MVDSCMECDQCKEGWEVFCRQGCVKNDVRYRFVIDMATMGDTA